MVPPAQPDFGSILLKSILFRFVFMFALRTELFFDASDADLAVVCETWMVASKRLTTKVLQVLCSVEQPQVSLFLPYVFEKGVSYRDNGVSSSRLRTRNCSRCCRIRHSR